MKIKDLARIVPSVCPRAPARLWREAIGNKQQSVSDEIGPKNGFGKMIFSRNRAKSGKSL